MSLYYGREAIIKEINLIPETKLQEIYDLIHYFRLGFENANKGMGSVMEFAGSWKDMPDDVYNDFAEDIQERRKKAFTRRRNNGASVD